MSVASAESHLLDRWRAGLLGPRLCCYRGGTPVAAREPPMPTHPEDMSPEEALAEARRRIADANATHPDFLDLGDIPLDELPDFGDMPHLRALALGYERPGRQGDQLTWSARGALPRFKGADLTPLGKL